MKKQNNANGEATQKGITLIALIITIIVLLILAGVTINLTLGENGIFKTAQLAAKNYTNAQEKELTDLVTFNNTVNDTINGNVKQTLASVAKPGDYVEYDGGNGYAGLWQVLYNDSTYGLQIISADIVTDLFTLGGSTEAEAKASYNNAVNTLNTECRKYVNSSYATSGRCVGSNPLSPDDPENMATVTLEFTYNGTTESGCKVADINYETDYNAMKLATSQNSSGIHNLGKSYWLASRNVDSNSNFANFYVRSVQSEGDRFDRLFWSVNSGGGSFPSRFRNGLRPVITLKSGIQTSSGNGSEGSPYKLVAQ